MKLISLVIENDDGTLSNLAAEPSADAPQVDESLYFDEWSAPDEYGCVRNRTADLFIDQLSKGDEFDQQVAESAPYLFAILLPDEEYTDEQRMSLLLNYAQGEDHFSYASGFIDKMLFRPFFADTGTWSDRKEENPLEGYATPILGVNPHNNADQFAMRYVDYLIGLAQKYRYAAGGGRKPGDGYS